jgi:hypothetical protein
MKKAFIILSTGATLTLAIALGSCNNAEEIKKKTDEQNSNIRSLADQKLNGLQDQVNTECTALVDSLAKVKLEEEEKANTHKGGGKTKPHPKPEPKKPEPKPETKTDIHNRGGSNQGNNGSTVHDRQGTNQSQNNNSTIRTRGGANTAPQK